MSYLTETRYHWFSVDSADDLSGALLELSTEDGVWAAAAHDTAPPSAAGYPPVAAGTTRYWWKALFGPGEPLKVLTPEVEVLGRLTVGSEVLNPEWTIYVSDALEPMADCWPIDLACSAEEWARYSESVQERAKALAVQTIRRLTGYRVGGCPVKVRPCSRYYRNRFSPWGEPWMTPHQNSMSGGR